MRGSGEQVEGFLVLGVFASLLFSPMTLHKSRN